MTFNLIKYINNPILLNEETIADITILAEQYPYFQSAQLLRVKNIHNIDPQSAKNALSFTAVYVTDRKILYYLLHAIQQQPEKVVETQEEISEESLLSKHEKIAKDTIQENIADTLTNQKEYVENSTDFEIEFTSAINIKKEYGKGIELDEYVVRMNGPESDMIELFSDIEEVDESEKEIKTEGNKVNDIKKEGAEIDIMHVIHKGVPAEKVIDLNNSLTNKQQKKNLLIDKFIQTNPKIVPQEYNAPNSDISANSIKEDEHLITDTLAKIYLHQGNYTKAIFAYEKLSLKYPEKSIYFADQISEIRKLIEKK